jgi:protein SCO1/2
MNGMVEALQEIKWSIGTEFDVINVSIDPTETPALASAKKRTYLKRYGRAGASSGWRFLTGDEQAIRQLAQQVGFKFAYDKPSRQYAHPSGLVILTSEGKVSSYLFGITYSSKDLLAALKGASSNQISSPIQKLILLCFHYNPITGKYGTAIMTTIRVLSIGTMLALVWLLIVSTRVARHRHECAIHSLPSKETS